MAYHLNIGDSKFKVDKDASYIDKSMLIAQLNAFVFSEDDRFVCITRPRRFGKTTAVNMLCAYYTKGLDSSKLFSDLKIAGDPSCTMHMNKYNVLMINILECLVDAKYRIPEMISNIYADVRNEILGLYPSLDFGNARNIGNLIQKVHKETNTGFIVIIDEWDSVFRHLEKDSQSHREYIDFLATLFKDNESIAIGYMTGILPIKKNGKHSSLNMFREYTMIAPGPFAEFAGFTDSEVSVLCSKSKVSYELMKAWYDSYVLGSFHVYSPDSIIKALTDGFKSHWTETETYEALSIYIGMDYDGLKESITYLISDSDSRVQISAKRFQNDLYSFSSADDILTLLVHLGYLAYDEKTSEVFIPNKEIKQQFEETLKFETLETTYRQILSSKELLEATWSKNSLKIAEKVEYLHSSLTTPSHYNSASSLAHVVLTSYSYAENFYGKYMEFPSGIGFVDILYIPKPKHFRYPCILVELKWNRSVNSAMSQILNNNYPQKIRELSDSDILLIGINYDVKNKKHTCAIMELKNGVLTKF